ncbi:hypothetical protein [Sphingomonas baiyangensis]|nr:hypothetical protein [Sphingomonas baiyangensis]
MTDGKGSEMATDLAEWIEPEVVELSVSETQGFPGRGGDGGRFIDCTLS